jgi:hypothetical protein
MEIDGNKIADQLVRAGSSHPLTGPGPMLGISANVAGHNQRMEEQETSGASKIHML